MRTWKKLVAFSMISALMLSQPAYAAIPYVGTKQEVKAQYEETSKKAQELANQLCQQYGVQSVQYALIDNGNIVLANHAGSYSRTENKALKNGMMYGIGSISKMYVTAAIMKLYDEGKVDLDAPVTTYIKEFQMADARYKNITVRMLLNHSSGLMGSTFKDAFSFGVYNKNANEDLLEALKTQRLKADPGAFSVYCNDGFTLAEIIVERVSGKDFSDYLQETFFTPIGMSNTKTPAQSFSTAKLTKTYLGNDATALPKEVVSVIGAGGIYASAADVCRMATVFMKDDATLSKKAKDEVQSEQYKNGIWPNVEDGIMAYGLGFDNVNLYPFHKYGIKALAKAGDTSFYHSSMIVLPEQNMAVAVLSSGGSSTYDQVVGQEILLTALKETGRITQIKPYEMPKTPIKTTIPDSVMEYAGYYAGTAIYDITMKKEGTLTLSYVGVEGIPDSTLYYTTDGDFATEDGSLRIRFVKESNGKVYLLQEQLSTLPALGQIKDGQYVAEKMEEHKVSDFVWNAWKQRDGKNYYLVDEPYHAQVYVGGSIARIALLDEIKGYMAQTTIENETLAQSFLQIPGLAGRDQSDIRFYKKGNVEYMEYNGRNYMSEDAVKTLPNKKNTTVKIASSGETQWYHMDSLVGKTVTVTVPKNASFAVYDENGQCVQFSLIAKNNKISVKKGYVIAFIGQPNSQFKLSYQK